MDRTRIPVQVGRWLGRISGTRWGDVLKDVLVNGEGYVGDALEPAAAVGDDEGGGRLLNGWTGKASTILHLGGG